jgi:hypothetical protein
MKKCEIIFFNLLHSACIAADAPRPIKVIKGRLGRPFESIDKAAPRGGVELRLAINLGIAATHGGYIDIRSRPRKRHVRKSHPSRSPTSA